MTDEERNLLIADITAQVVKDLTGKDLRVAQDKSKPLAEVYEKYKDELHKKYGNVIWANVWDCVRKLATYRAGHRYVRDLLPSEEVEASEFAEGILKEMLVEERGYENSN